MCPCAPCVSSSLQAATWGLMLVLMLGFSVFYLSSSNFSSQCSLNLCDLLCTRHELINYVQEHNQLYLACVGTCIQGMNYSIMWSKIDYHSVRLIPHRRREAICVIITRKLEAMNTSFCRQLDLNLVLHSCIIKHT